MLTKISLTLGCLLALTLFVGCVPTPVRPTQPASLPNPASVYCGKNGGKLAMRQGATGGVAGICVFPDGSECDEWAYFRGECKPGDSLIKPTVIENSTSTSSPEVQKAQIVFYANSQNGYDNVYLIQVDSHTRTQLTHNEFNTFSGPFAPNGAHILFTGFGLTHSYVGLMNLDGSDQVDLTNQPDSDEAFPAWSPNGRQIAFTSRRDGNNEIYIMNADGLNPRRLTNSPKDDFAPAWSPDGSRIVFASDRDNQTGVYSLYLMNADGTGVARLTNDKSSDSSPDWSPDGTRIVYQSIRDGQADIYLVNVDGTGQINLTQNPADDYAPRWSPDGSQIAFQTKRDANWEIYIMDADGTQPSNLTNDPADDQSPYWQPLSTR